VITMRKVLVLVLLTACGIKPEENYNKMRSLLLSEKYSDAANFIEGQKEKFYGENNAVLYYMDKMVALHLAGRYKESSGLVDKASDKIEELYTASISKNAAAILTSDNVLPFEGEDFEKVLIHVIGALNYTFAGDRDGALVEARRVEEKLTVMNDRAAKDGKDAKKGEYSEDAFIRWFIGALFETEAGEQSMNDALIAYKKAMLAYEKTYTPKYRTPMPSIVLADLLRTSDQLHFDEDFQMVKKKFPQAQFVKQTQAATMGEIVLIHLNGEAPYKVDKTWEITHANKIIKVAYPEFVVKPKSITTAQVSVGPTTTKTETMEDVTAIALQSLKDRMGRVKAKMVARAIAKYLAAVAAQVATEKASGSGLLGSLARTAASVAGAATEQADKRSWLMLPSSIDVAKLYVPAGTHNVTVTFQSAGGGVVGTKQIPNVTVKPGKKVFLSVRTM